MMRRFTISSLAAVMVLGTVTLPAAAQEDGAFTLTVLHSNDGESALLPDDYEFTGDEDLVDLACPQGAEAPGFGDLAEASVHFDAVACGVANDIIRGTSASTFDPFGTLTRGQTASLLFRMLDDAGVELPALSGAPNFPDIGPPHGDAIRRLAAADIIEGRNDGSFGTQQPVFRDQLASLLVRALSYVRGEPIEPEGDNPFNDVDGGPHEANIVAGSELGLIQGKGDGRFAPRDTSRRDQAASLVIRLLGRVNGETIPAGGSARFVDFVKTLQAQGTGTDAGVVTISSGDNFLAGPEYTASVESFEDGGAFYDAEVYKEAGYDAMTIGNHEFDFGPAGLAQFIDAFEGDTPFLSANLGFSDEAALAGYADDGDIAGSTVIDVDGRQVGIIGATTEDLASVSAPGNNIVINDVLPAVEAEVASLQEAEVDIIVLASHLQNLENERDLIAELSGVDAVVGGGGAEDLRDDYPFIVEDADDNEVPLVTTPGSYRDVGQLVLEFDADGVLTAVGDDSALLMVPPYGPQDADTLANVEVPVTAALAALADEIVADAEVPLDARTSSVRTRETNLANLLTDGMMRASQDRSADFGVPVADVALQNGGGIRGDAVMTESELSALFTFNTAPFGNRIAVDTVSGEKLIELIEHGLSGLPGVEGRFGHWAGVEFTYDVDEEAGSRLVEATVTRGTADTADDVELVVAGVPTAAALTEDFTLVGLNFTLNCGDSYPFPGCDEDDVEDVEFTELGLTDQQAFQNHLEAIGTVTAADYPDLTVDEDRYNRYGPDSGGIFLP